MNKKLGIDIGNHSIKTSAGVSFEAKVEKAGAIAGGKCVRIKKDGVIYNIGKGHFDSSQMKYDKSHFDVLLAAAIGLSTDNRDVDVCVGLPVNFWEKGQQAMLDKLKENRYLEYEISKDGGPWQRRVNLIKNANVVPEGYAAFVKLVAEPEIANALQEGYSCFIIDIGGRTIDMCKIDPDNTVSREQTKELGMIDFYEELVDAIKNVMPGYKNGVEGIEKIVSNGFVHKSPNGTETDLSFIKGLLDARAQQIFETIRSSNMDYDNYKVILCGGGLHILQPYLETRYYNHYFNNDRFLNANGFELFALQEEMLSTLVEDHEVEMLIKNKGKVVGANA